MDSDRAKNSKRDRKRVGKVVSVALGGMAFPKHCCRDHNMIL